ncbi:MAG: hypothetical protein SNH79_05925 [Rikenellaceae bacterium]
MKNRFGKAFSNFFSGRYGVMAKQYLSPIFLLFIVASFVLWYIAKLSYSYTTDIEVKVKLEDNTFVTKCVVEGVGTNLLGYNIRRQVMTIPLSELGYSVVNESDSVSYLRLDSSTFVNAVSVRCSDIKVVSVDVPKRVDVTPRLQRLILNK